MRTLRALSELVTLLLAFIKWVKGSFRSAEIKKEIEDASKTKDTSSIERRLND